MGDFHYRHSNNPLPPINRHVGSAIAHRPADAAQASESAARAPAILQIRESP